MAKEVNSDNYYTVYYWMSTELGLNGVDKDLYALIYGYYKNNGKECYYSYSQLAAITGTSKNTVIRSLGKLSKNGFIEIHEKSNGKKYYSIVSDKVPRNVCKDIF